MTSTYSDMIEKIRQLESEANELLKTEKKAAIQQIKEKMERFNITAADIGSVGSRTKKAKITVDPKYRNPTTGETWTGRGRAPRWLADAEARGSARQSYLILG